MELTQFFKSIIDMDRCAVVVCDINHDIVYMNPAAVVNYHGDLTGKSIKFCHNKRSGIIIDKVLEWFAKDKDNNIIHTFFNEKQNKDVYMVALRNEDGSLIGYYEKHEFRNRDMSALYEGIEVPPEN